MSNITIFLLILFIIILPATMIAYYMFFKKTITYIIGLFMTIPVMIAIILSYFVGSQGINHLYWATPVVIIFLFGGYYLIHKQVGLPLKKLSQIIKLISKGDLTVKIDEKTSNQKNELGEISSSVAELTAYLNKVLSNVKESANLQSSVSNALNMSAQEMSNISSEQAASFEEVSSTLEQILEKTRTNNSKSKNAGNIISNTVNKIEINNENVRKTVESLNQIAEKINIINDIAFQTNILSLNASVEAAAAGEYGKGFSVVAKEVGKLAERSKTSAYQIREISNTSKEIAGKTETVSKDMVPEIQNTSEVIQEIIINYDEQLRNVEQISASLSELNNSVQKLASSSEETAASADELSNHAEKLRKLTAFFKT